MSITFTLTVHVTVEPTPPGLCCYPHEGEEPDAPEVAGNAPGGCDPLPPANSATALMVSAHLAKVPMFYASPKLNGLSG